MRNILFTAVLFLMAVMAVGSASAQSPSTFGYNSNVGIITGSTWKTDTVVSSTIKNNFWSGGNFLLDINDTLGTASVVLTIQGLDETSGEFYTLLTSAAKTAPGQTLMTIFPGAPTTANVSANLQIPKFFRAILYVPAGDSVKATVGVSLISQ